MLGCDWTSSVAIADVDGDGNADIIDVGYCGGKLVFEHDCLDEKLNQPRSCSPLAFEAQRDRIWRGMGDGRFEDASGLWLGPHEPGRGLGLVVGQLDATAGLDIYIANDMTANHYWSISTETDHERFQLSEQAMLRGLAVNERSVSQASMGIAASDADNDGDLDFLLTHFSDDYNTLYEQIGSGLWADRSRKAGLVEPSLSMLGYGTQWLDCDNDGTVELFVANGDIDDFSHVGRRFKQPAQIFLRLPEGHFVELPIHSMGNYFLRDHLGRAVVTLDANRDGSTDLLITHLFEPVSLLINKTVADSKSVRFFLRAYDAHRDAIGCRVTVKFGPQTQTQFLLAGNGFQCSNERVLTFGVGKANQVDRVVVDWPNGDQNTYSGILSGNDYLLIQGTLEAFDLGPHDE
jgi:hypothetical protein